MKILFLTKYDQSGASSQVRAYQFIKHFEKRGIKCTIKPFLTKDITKTAPFSPRWKNLIIRLQIRFKKTLAFIKRYRDVLSAYRYDGVVVQKDILPYGLQSLLKLTNKKIIFDFDDAIWELAPSQKSLFHGILKKAKIVIADNSYLGNYAKKFNPKVAVISAPIDTALYKPSVKKGSKKIVLGWVGSPSTTYLLKNMADVLNTIGKKYSNVELHNIGGAHIELKGMPVKNREWSKNKVTKYFSEFDIGLMPLDDSDLNKGRLGYKMIIYFSLGIPVVAQAIGLNKEVIINGKNGYLAKTKKEWVEAISRLIENPRLRVRLGRRARQIAEEQFDIDICAKKYTGLFFELKDQK